MPVAPSKGLSCLEHPDEGVDLSTLFQPKTGLRTDAGPQDSQDRLGFVALTSNTLSISGLEKYGGERGDEHGLIVHDKPGRVPLLTVFKSRWVEGAPAY